MGATMFENEANCMKRFKPIEIILALLFWELTQRMDEIV